MAFQEPTLREDHVTNRFRFADYPGARRFVGNPARQTDAIDALDDGAHVGLLRRGDRIGPGIQQARIDVIAAKSRGETLAVFLASSFVDAVPRRVRGWLVVADHDRDAERRRISKKTP